MGRLCRFFIILILACTAAGCDSAIGSIDGSGGSGGQGGGQDAPDIFWVVPKQDTYNLNDPFRRNDLEVYTSYQGVEKRVPIDDVEIGIADNPDLPDVMNYVPSGNDYQLKTAGKKTVVVEYRNMSDRYSIEVLDAPGKETGSGIIIEWAK